MNLRWSLLLLALAAWSAHTGTALGTTIVSVVTFGLFAPLACLCALITLLLDTQSLEEMADLNKRILTESTLRWLAVMGTLAYLLHAGHGATAGALWLAEIVALSIRHTLRQHLLPSGREPA